MSAITLAEAVNQALAYELAHDHDTIVIGEDVGNNGGVFRVTDGLQKKFSDKRVIDSPLAESMLAGMAVGMATQGLKPIVEFQFSGFIYSALDHIISHASRMRNRTRGRLTCPIVFRAPFGGGIHAPEHHSESNEALFAHIPGVRVVIPSSPARAYGLLLASIRDPDPVVFLEPKRMYRLLKQHVPDNGEALPLDKCFILRQGADITLISWGAMIHETLQVASQLANMGIEAEVIDVATVSPIDIETILESIEKTGYCVIIHEAARNCGIGAEISAQINEYAFEFLSAPVQRVTGYDTIMPYFKNEKKYMPTVARIMTAVDNILECL